jgi:hypothetical protein
MFAPHLNDKCFERGVGQGSLRSTHHLSFESLDVDFYGGWGSASQSIIQREHVHIDSAGVCGFYDMVVTP